MVSQERCLMLIIITYLRNKGELERYVRRLEVFGFKLKVKKSEYLTANVNKYHPIEPVTKLASASWRRRCYAGWLDSRTWTASETVLLGRRLVLAGWLKRFACGGSFAFSMETKTASVN
ncbi:unnamed protein product [Heligmosomoides polygyrus]|uniref:HTH_21 domain-containing protein n=1 Tax=Heligmosomoides polygyrus TaxID=6339 RepID=A0A183FZQ8_HELPZ|nr:unnamed protein product [Heligmosomoides polygyrus]